MSAWDKQQTIETIRQHADLTVALVYVSNERAEQGRREYRAEQARKCKLRLIRAWRAKQRAVA